MLAIVDTSASAFRSAVEISSRPEVPDLVEQPPQLTALDLQEAAEDPRSPHLEKGAATAEQREDGDGWLQRRRSSKTEEGGNACGGGERVQKRLPVRAPAFPQCYVNESRCAGDLGREVRWSQPKGRKKTRSGYRIEVLAHSQGWREKERHRSRNHGGVGAGLRTVACTRQLLLESRPTDSQDRLLATSAAPRWLHLSRPQATRPPSPGIGAIAQGCRVSISHARPLSGVGRTEVPLDDFRRQQV